MAGSGCARVVACKVCARVVGGSGGARVVGGSGCARVVEDVSLDFFLPSAHESVRTPSGCRTTFRPTYRYPTYCTHPYPCQSMLKSP